MTQYAQQLATRLEALESRFTQKGRADPWYLSWQLLVGVIHSLHEAKRLLPKSPKKSSELRADTVAILQRIHGSASVPMGSWELGYFLGSAELRIQAATHRLLKTFTNRRDRADAFPLVREILLGCAQCRRKPLLSAATLDILKGFNTPLPSRIGPSPKPGVALRAVWDQANSFKHNQRHTPIRSVAYHKRWKLAERALHEVVSLLDDMGSRRGALAAV
jgi:hypothetical protein